MHMCRRGRALALPGGNRDVNTAMARRMNMSSPKMRGKGTCAT